MLVFVRLDDMKKLYDGFDLCAPSTSVSMTSRLRGSRRALGRGGLRGRDSPGYAVAARRAGRALPRADRRIQGAQADRAARPSRCPSRRRARSSSATCANALGRPRRRRSEEAERCAARCWTFRSPSGTSSSTAGPPTPTARSSPTRPTGRAASSSRPSPTGPTASRRPAALGVQRGRPRRDLRLELPGAPGGLLRHALHGRGDAHA